jgi:hypothetical protein
MKGTVKFLSGKSGHDTIPFDTEAGVVDEAQKILAEQVFGGSAIFDGTTKERITPPNTCSGRILRDMRGRTRLDMGAVLREHEDIVIVPPMAGG